MNEHTRVMIDCLEKADVEGMRRLWREVAPKMPQHGDSDTLIKIHMTRTMTEAVGFKYRAYSHRWLVERGLPSYLPDDLKPKADRLYPVIAPTVGIMVNSKYPKLKAEIVRVMSDAVMEAEADGKLTEDDYVRSRMLAARADIKKKLMG